MSILGIISFYQISPIWMETVSQLIVNPFTDVALYFSDAVARQIIANVAFKTRKEIFFF